MKLGYGNGDGDHWDPVGTVQINPDEKEHVNVEDKKVNKYGISRMRPECKIETVCSNDFKRDPITVDKYIPYGNGPKKFVPKVCGDDGHIKEISLSCDAGKKRDDEDEHVIDALEVMKSLVKGHIASTEEQEKKEDVMDALKVALSAVNAKEPSSKA